MSRIHTLLTDPLAQYLRDVTLREPEPLRRLREETEDHPQASMQTSPEQGQFLHLMARLCGARRTVEVGVFMGYSSAWVALALPADGRVVACDRSEEYTRRARQTWRETGVEERVDLRLGAALDTLRSLLDEGQAGSFDFAFIDADKGNYGNYYECALALLRPGGLLAADNTLWKGNVVDDGDHSPDTEAIREFNCRLHADRRVALSLVPLGDGLSLAYKL